ncbi:hypothetical protein FQN50_004919 [Emmonsiellopsis sp. PD_5]|nr:hypothetical protein FQN50_004919 [Emmonsiellopsis sp. PD_5]
MAFQFRSSRSSRSQTLAENPPSRTRSGQVEHDVFEGLPVRRWARQPIVISQNPKNDEPDGRLGGPNALPELPMPKDSHLLTPMSRALLRAARAGCKYIRPAPNDVDDDDDKEVKEVDEATTAPSFERTFTAGKWTVIPRHLEPPEVEFLAERRHGLPSLYGSAAFNGTVDGGVVQVVPKPPPMRKTKFKKVDPTTGNISIYTALVPEGHTVEGEIAEDVPVVAEAPDATVVAASPAPGTIVEGVGVVDKEGVVVAGADQSMVAPIKKRYPPPKRKAKGAPKGRRKKVMFAPGEGEVAPITPGAPGAMDGAADVTMSGTGQNGNSGATTPGQEEDEDEDEENEGEESDEGEESAPESKSPGAAIKSEAENGNTPAPAESVQPKAEPEEPSTLPQPQQQTDAKVPARDMSSSPDLPLAAASTNRNSKPSSEELPIQPQSQSPTAPAQTASPISSLPLAETTAPETDKEPSINNEQPPPSEAPTTEANARDPSPKNIQDQNDATEPPKKSASPTTGPSPTQPTEQQPQQSPSHENPESKAPDQPETIVHFEDGEVDLLGSLEASLDGPVKSRISPDQAASADKDQEVKEAPKADDTLEAIDEGNTGSDEKNDVEMAG